MATTFNSLSFSSETFAMTACIKVKRWNSKMYLDKFLALNISSRHFSPTVAQELHSIFFSLTLRSAVQFLPALLISTNRPLITAHFVFYFARSSCCQYCCCRRVSFVAISCRSFVSDCVLCFSEDVRSAAKSAFDIFILE